MTMTMGSLKVTLIVKNRLFTQKGGAIKNISPTKDALAQHLLQVGYEAGHVSGKAIIKAPQLTSPAVFGWTWETSNAQ